MNTHYFCSFQISWGPKSTIASVLLRHWIIPLIFMKVECWPRDPVSGLCWDVCQTSEIGEKNFRLPRWMWRIWTARSTWDIESGSYFWQTDLFFLSKYTHHCSLQSEKQNHQRWTRGEDQCHQKNVRVGDTMGWKSSLPHCCQHLEGWWRKRFQASERGSGKGLGELKRYESLCLRLVIRSHFH